MNSGDRQLIQLLGPRFAGRLLPVRRVIRATLIATPLLLLAAVSVALSWWPWRLAAVLPLALAPFVSLMIENFGLYGRGKRISSELTSAGVSVGEPIFARSVGDVVSWAERNRVTFEAIRAIGNGDEVGESGHSPVGDPSIWRAQGWEGVLGEHLAARLAPWRKVAIAAAVSPLLIVGALIVSAVSGASTIALVLMAVVLSTVLVLIASWGTKRVSEEIAGILRHANITHKTPPRLRSLPAFRSWCLDNQLPFDVVATVSRGLR
jgi:hypothetical protein